MISRKFDAQAYIELFVYSFFLYAKMSYLSLFFGFMYLAHNFFVIKKLNIKYKDYFLLILLIIIGGVTIFNDINVCSKLIGTFLFPILFVIFYNNDKKKLRIPNIKLLILITLYIFYQVLTIKYIGTSRGTLVNSGQDPNISAVFIYLYFLFLDSFEFFQSKRKIIRILKVIVVISGFLTGSRNFLLGVVVLYIFKLNFVKKLLKKFKLNKFLNFVLAINIALYLWGNNYVKNFYIKTNYNEKATFYERIMSSKKDWSNYFRFLANKKVLDSIILNEFRVIGYSTNYPKYLEEIKVINVPHNALGIYIVVFGIFSVLIFFILNKIINENLNKKNIPYMYSICTYSLFLGTPLMGTNLMIFFILIKNTKDENCKSKCPKIQKSDILGSDQLLD